MYYEQDYILRLIQRVGVMLRAMVAALREHRPDDALQTSREALHHITGLSEDAAETLPAATLLSMMSVGGRVDVRRSLLLAEVYAQRASACQLKSDPDGAERERDKALLFAETARSAADGEDLERAEALLEMLAEDSAASR